MLNEGRKILDHPSLEVSCTCVRVPVMRAHSMSINAEFEKPVSVDLAREAIDNFEGSELRDDPSNLVYPMPVNYSERVPCGVGRIQRRRIGEWLFLGLSVTNFGRCCTERNPDCRSLSPIRTSLASNVKYFHLSLPANIYFINLFPFNTTWNF